MLFLNLQLFYFFLLSAFIPLFTKYFVAFLANIEAPCFTTSSPPLNVVFKVGSKIENKRSRNCTILDSWVSVNFILNDESFAKALKSLESYVSVNDNSCRKLVSSLELLITFDEWFKVTSVPFFIPDLKIDITL